MALLIASAINSANVVTDFFLQGIQRRATNFNSVNFTFANNAGHVIKIAYKPGKAEKPETATISYKVNECKIADIDALFSLEPTLKDFVSFETLNFTLKDGVVTYIWKLNRKAIVPVPIG